MADNNDQGLLNDDDQKHDNLSHASESDSNKKNDELNRRRALRAILSASTLVVINPFLIGAESKSLFVTVTPTPSTSVTPSTSLTPTPSSSVTPSTSLTPTPSTSLTPTPSSSVTPSTSLTPTPSSSVTPSASLTPTPSSSVTPSASLTPTPSTSLTPTPSSSVTPSTSLTPTPSSSVTPSISLTPTPSTSVTPSNTPTPTPTPSTSAVPLPVEISEFGVTEKDGVINLYWKTETEHNNRGFEIQRSTNTILFNKMGWVDGAGDSSQPQTYSFDEINVESNRWYYYRLKQVDFNGTNAFSKTVAIMINEEEKTVVKDISPTIVTDNYVNIEIAAGSTDTAQVVINSIHGRLISRKSVMLSKGLNTIRMEISNTSSGLYFVQVKFGKGKTQTKRFVVAR